MERFGGLEIIWFVEFCRKKDVEGRGEKGDNDIKRRKYGVHFNIYLRNICSMQNVSSLTS